MEEKLFEQLGGIKTGIDNIKEQLGEQKKEIKNLNENYNKIDVRLSVVENCQSDIKEIIDKITEKQAIINGAFKEKQKLWDMVNFAIRNPKKLFLFLLGFIILSATGSGTYIFVNKILAKLNEIVILLEKIK